MGIVAQRYPRMSTMRASAVRQVSTLGASVYGAADDKGRRVPSIPPVLRIPYAILRRTQCRVYV